MGLELVRAISRASDVELVGCFDRQHQGESIGSLAGVSCNGVMVAAKFGATLDECKPDVVVDFTHLSAAPDHALSSLKRKIPVIIGTSGLSTSDLSAIRDACNEYQTPAALIPNFAIGAVLMTTFAEQAAKFLPDVEVIEYHHKGKLDAPSGTALHTAERIAEARTQRPAAIEGAVEKVPGSRGGKHRDVTVHAVRLPGFVASQEVIFGSDGERLVLRHDSIDRACFMPGVLLTLRKIRSMTGFTIGLDKFLN